MKKAIAVVAVVALSMVMQGGSEPVEAGGYEPCCLQRDILAGELLAHINDDGQEQADGRHETSVKVLDKFFGPCAWVDSHTFQCEGGP
jgi:hypothetical protein